HQVLGAARDHRAADEVAVAAEVLCGAVHDKIGAELEGLLQVGRGEGVVHGDQAAGAVALGGDGRDVGQVEQRVCGRLEPDELRAGHSGEGGGIGGGRVVRGVGHLQTPAAVDLLAQAVGAPAKVPPGDDSV